MFKKIFISLVLFIILIFFFTPKINFPLKKSIEYYNSQNEIFYQEYFAENGYHQRISLEKVPQHIQDAFLLLEDKNFYHHFGIDPFAILRAFYLNLKYKKIISGGSGINQQLVRNYLKPKKRNIFYKIKEALIAIKANFYYDKNKIFEEYLNTIYFGNQAYGIKSASQTFFNKDPQELSIKEAVFLAGLPQSPSVYNPFIKSEASLKRMETVKKILKKNKYFNKHCLEKNIDKCIEENFSTPPALNYSPALKTAIHYKELVLKELKNIIDLKNFNLGNLKIYTYLDNKVFQESENIIKKNLLNLKEKNISNVAVVILDNTNHSIINLIGSADYYNKDIQGQVNNANSLRQAGSTIKPFTYALAFENGKTPQSIINDSFIHLKTNNNKPYEPKNYDFKEYGNVSYKKALANSYNISAIKIAKEVGTENLLQTLRFLGLKTLSKNADNYGLALTLGDGEIRLIDLTKAYSVFNNQGKIFPYRFIKKIVYQNKIIYEKPDFYGEKIFSKTSVNYINEILSDNLSRFQQFGEKSPLKTNFFSASKTGTTRNFRDNWTIGYNKKYTVGVWVGNANGDYLKKSTGITGAAPIWNDIITYLNQKKPSVFSNKLLTKTSNTPLKNYSLKDYPENKEYFVIKPQNNDVFLKNDKLDSLVFKANKEVYWDLDNIFFKKGKKIFWDNPLKGSHCIEVFKDEKKLVKITKNCFIIK
jgi:penicillin-binding protein 1C